MLDSKGELRLAYERREGDMQVTQVVESEIIPIKRDGAFSPEPVLINGEFEGVPGMGGLAGTEVDRAIGSVRCLIVQLDSRIAHTKRSLQELEAVRGRLIEGLKDLSSAGAN